MGRRRSTVMEDLLAIAASLPWWVGLGLSVGSFFLLQRIASSKPPSARELGNIGPVAFHAVMIGAAKVATWVLPTIFAVGAALSGIRRIKSRSLVEGYADRNAQSPVTWREFEALVGEIYRRQGYGVAETPAGPDGGVDLVLCRGDELLLVQCKHWQARLVDVKVVRELKGVVAARCASGGVVVTSGVFTSDAVEFSKQARIDLIDGQRLQTLSQQLSGSESKRTSQVSVLDRSPRGGSTRDFSSCPVCGSPMVLRTAKRGRNSGGQFWGCQTFPKCKGTRQVQA